MRVLTEFDATLGMMMAVGETGFGSSSEAQG
jgi:hypothetical protein